MKTVDAIVKTVERLQQTNESAGSSRFTTRQAVLEGLRRLVVGGFIQQVPEIVDESQDDAEDEEFEFGASPPQAKKRRTNKSSVPEDVEDPAVVALLQCSGPYRILPRDAVWRVNVQVSRSSQFDF